MEGKGRERSQQLHGHHTSRESRDSLGTSFHWRGCKDPVLFRSLNYRSRTEMTGMNGGDGTTGITELVQEMAFRF